MNARGIELGERQGPTAAAVELAAAEVEWRERSAAELAQARSGAETARTEAEDELRRAREESAALKATLNERDTALADEDLIRTKVSLIPESVVEIRVVDIVGLDKQADGGTHVRSTAEVGRIAVVKTESKGKGNKRIRLRVEDA